MRKHRLVCVKRDHSIAIFSGHIFRGQHRMDSGMVRDKCIQVAEVKSRAMVGTANSSNGQRADGYLIGAKKLAAFHLAFAVQADHALADRMPSLW